MILVCWSSLCSLFFFFNDPATTEIYTLSLHDALPICPPAGSRPEFDGIDSIVGPRRDSGRSLDKPRDGPFDVSSPPGDVQDRKSTRLNSSHLGISYAVFCLKKKNKKKKY